MRHRLFSSVVLGLVGCGHGSGGDTGPAVRDSAGVALVLNRVSIDGSRPRYVVDSAPIFDIGGRFDPNYDFNDGMRAVLLPDGRIVVTARGPELRWFDSMGRWIRTVGRAGSGPGEFRQIDLLQGQRDSVATYDLALRRFSVFDTAGRYSRGTVLTDLDTLGFSYPVAWMPDGRLLLDAYAVPRVAGLRRDSALIRIGSPTGAPVATIGRFPEIDQLIQIGPRGVGEQLVPFARRSFWASIDSFVVIATNERFGFDLYDQAGHLVRRSTRSAVPLPVTAADVSKWIEAKAARFPAGMEDRKAVFRRTMESTPRLPFHAFYDRLLVSARGEIWLREDAEADQSERASVFAVFDTRGRWLARVEVPRRAEPLAIDRDRLLAAFRDADDVVHLRTYQVRDQGGH